MNQNQNNLNTNNFNNQMSQNNNISGYNSQTGNPIYSNQNNTSFNNNKKSTNNKLVIAIIVIIVLIVIILLLVRNIMWNNYVDEKYQEAEEQITDDIDSIGDIDDIVPDNSETNLSLEYVTKCNIKLKDGEEVIYDNKDNSKYSSVAEYLKNQENLTAVLTYYYLDEEGSSKSINHTFTQSEIDNMFVEMENSKVSTSDGIGFLGGSVLKIKYTKQEKEVYADFTYLDVLNTNDGDLIKIVDRLLGNDYETYDGFCNYSIENIGSTVKNISESLEKKAYNS